MGYYARTSNFSLQISNFFAKKAGPRAHLAVRKIVIDVGTRIVERSPVGDATLWKSKPPPGYVGGRFKANWQYGNTRTGVPTGELPDIDPTGKRSIERIEEVPERAGGMVHTIVNNLPYAQPLEDGWSSQAPSGMVHLTVIEFQDIVRAAALEAKNEI